MASITPYQAQIETALSGQVEGLSLDALLAATGLAVDRTTLFRHVRLLIAAGRVERSGRARASRYRLLGIARIRAHLARPYTQRPPVRYVRDFLDGYVPGKTTLFTPPELQQLHQAGQVDMGAAPAGTYARRIYERLMIDLSYASSKLEGNTYNLLDTERLVRFGEELSTKDRKEAVMILNHKEAIRYIVDNLAEVDLTRRDLLNVHALLSDGLLADPMYSGRLRRSLVQISASSYVPLDNPYQIEEEFDVVLKKMAQIREPFEQALFLLVFLPYLQPFEDVNKRTSRVGANIPLLKCDLCPLSFIAVDERDYLEGTLGVYELNDVALLKQAFIDGYVRSAANYQHVRAEIDNVSVGALEYRAVVKDAIRRVVRDWQQLDENRLRAELTGMVKPEHLAEVMANIKKEVLGLHEGNLVRFGLSHAELSRFESQDASRK